MAQILADVRAELAAQDDEDARRFLDTLDPSSQEGMWFDAFAESFSSRLDAARAYCENRVTRSAR